MGRRLGRRSGKGELSVQERGVLWLHSSQENCGVWGACRPWAGWQDHPRGRRHSPTTRRVGRAGLSPVQDSREKEPDEPRVGDRTALSLWGGGRSRWGSSKGQRLHVSAPNTPVHAAEPRSPAQCPRDTWKTGCSLHTDNDTWPHLSLDQDLPVSPTQISGLALERQDRKDV